MNHECQKDMHFVLTQSKMSIRQSVPNIWGLNYNLQLSAKHPLLHTHSNSILTKPNSNNRPIRLTGSTQRGPSLPFHPIIFLLFKVKLCAFLCTTCHQKTINVLQIQRIWIQYPACPCAAGQNTFCTLFAWQIKEAALKWIHKWGQRERENHYTMMHTVWETYRRITSGWNVLGLILHVHHWPLALL